MFQRSSLTALWPLQAGVAERTARTRPQQTALGLALIAGLVLILCLYLQQASRITATSYDIHELQAQRARLQRENSNLLAQYAYDRSVKVMNRRAIAAGFRPATAGVRYVVLAPASPAVQTVAAFNLPAPSPDIASSPLTTFTSR